MDAVLPGAIVRELQRGDVWNLAWGREWKLGRRQSCYIRLKDPSVHSGQAMFRFHDAPTTVRGSGGVEHLVSGFAIHDYHEVNPLFLNGEVLRGRVVSLRTGDIFRLGDYSELRFESGETPPAAGPAADPRAPFEEAIGAADVLGAAPRLHAITLATLEGRLERGFGLRAIARLAGADLPERIASLRETAAASARDGTDTGLRVTAQLLLDRLARSGDEAAVRILRSMGPAVGKRLATLRRESDLD